MPEPIRIVLSMIVKNESANMPRCLEAAAPILDAYCICDTGSTDNTIEVIKMKTEELKIPGRVCVQEFAGFGPSRTYAFQRTVQLAKKYEWDLDRSYALLVDADMVLENAASFDKSQLNAKGHGLIQYFSNFSSRNWRLLQLSQKWQCYRRTHEFWGCDDCGDVFNACIPRESLRICDIGDGGCKANKFTRDHDLLLKDLEENGPKDARSLFYLGQTSENMQEHEEAIQWYKKRRGVNEFDPEIWYATFAIAGCYYELYQKSHSVEHWDLTLHWYQVAHKMSPKRAEPLLRLARMHRDKDQPKLAYGYAIRGLRLPIPTGYTETFFMQDAVYAYDLLYELSIAAYYVGANHDGLLACDRLITMHGVPNSHVESAKQNLMFYARPIDASRIIDVKPSLPEPYVPCNPGLCKLNAKNGNGYIMICRSVNYHQTGARWYDIHDPDQVVRTKNWFMELKRNSDGSLEPDMVSASTTREMKELKPRAALFPGKVSGLEDCRLVFFKNKYYFTCTNLEGNEQHIPRIYLGELEAPDRIVSLIELQAPNGERCEKNWLPFVEDDELKVLYSVDPVVIYKVDVQTGHLTLCQRFQPHVNLSQCRGSSAPIKFNDAYLVTVHEVVVVPKGNNDIERIYLHRLLEFDLHFTRLLRSSAPFFFSHKGVEFCCSAVRVGKDIVFGVGIEDRECKLVHVSGKTINALLSPASLELKNAEDLPKEAVCEEVKDLAAGPKPATTTKPIPACLPESPIVFVPNAPQGRLQAKSVPDYGLIDWAAQFCKGDGTFVDVGAFCGSWSIVLASKCKRVMAFEPHPKYFYRLCAGLVCDDLWQIEAQNVALTGEDSGIAPNSNGVLFELSESGGDCTMRHDLLVDFYSRLHKIHKNIVLRTLDSYNLENVDLIKIDTEGCEWHVIQGAKQTIVKNKMPPILYRCSSLTKNTDNIDDLLKSEFGYRIHQVSGCPGWKLSSMT